MTSMSANGIEYAPQAITAIYLEIAHTFFRWRREVRKQLTLSVVVSRGLRNTYLVIYRSPDSDCLFYLYFYHRAVPTDDSRRQSPSSDCTSGIYLSDSSAGVSCISGLQVLSKKQPIEQ